MNIEHARLSTGKRSHPCHRPRVALIISGTATKESQDRALQHGMLLAPKGYRGVHMHAFLVQMGRDDTS